MNSRTLITLARLAVGGGIMVASMFTGVNGQVQMFSMFLMGAPLELLQSKDEKKEKKA